MEKEIKNAPLQAFVTERFLIIIIYSLCFILYLLKMERSQRIVQMIHTFRLGSRADLRTCKDCLPCLKGGEAHRVCRGDTVDPHIPCHFSFRSRADLRERRPLPYNNVKRNQTLRLHFSRFGKTLI